MTNYQKFVKELTAIWESGQQFGVKNGKPAKCSSIMCCEGCKFNGEGCFGGCAVGRQDWLKEDYKEDRSNVVIVAKYEDIYKSIEKALNGCGDRPCCDCAYNELDALGYKCKIDLVAEQIYQDTISFQECEPVGLEALMKEFFKED